MSKILRMQVYYIAFDYVIGTVEMIDGPYGTFEEAQSELVSIDSSANVDKRLIIVQQTLEVLDVHRGTD
jgi:hypothetical protein